MILSLDLQHCLPVNSKNKKHHVNMIQNTNIYIYIHKHTLQPWFTIFSCTTSMSPLFIFKSDDFISCAHADSYTCRSHGSLEQQQYTCLGNTFACLEGLSFNYILFSFLSCVWMYACPLIIFLHSATCINRLVLSISVSPALLGVISYMLCRTAVDVLAVASLSTCSAAAV